MSHLRPIVRSGGQTGVDRAALDAALACGLTYEGWCPRGGWAEDLPAPPGLLALYPRLKETPGDDPDQRTEWNVRDSDLTFLLVPGAACASPGTELTASFARALKKPLFGFAVDSDTSVKAMAAVCKTMRGHVRLNIAGPRESEHPGIYRTTRDLLARLFLILA
ncbi:YpsA SLOG family protein [Blastochloris tepida]|uniref:Molybdenum cofactor carrier n=1 Tax=Blastochloris tepida TaxID=2233851 RepID=A0A348FYU8_9HYPH|nr:putative molybdenum carrier protein [Blastochloris tepida]BBF92481.1 hypothetical protein BLTE_11660 [Blastochloris tepida]